MAEDDDGSPGGHTMTTGSQSDAARDSDEAEPQGGESGACVSSAARASVQQLRVAFDALDEAIFLSDPISMRFIDVNGAASRLFAYTREELHALGPAALFGIPDDDLRQEWSNDGSGECPIEVRVNLQQKNKSEITVEVNHRRIRIADSRLILTVVRTIPEKVAAAERVAMQQELLAGFGQLALADTPIEELLDSAIAILQEGLGTTYCRLMKLVPSGDSLELIAGAGWCPDWPLNSQLDLVEETEDRFIYGARDFALVSDYPRERRFRPSPMIAAHALRSAVEVLVCGTEGPIGVLGVYAAPADAFTTDSVSFLRSIAHIIGAVFERKQAEDRLTYLAEFDALTALPNRERFIEQLSETLIQAENLKRKCAVLFIDLDRFKTVNDTLGHSAGDRLLGGVAKRLIASVRPGDTVGRLSGDEFAIAVANMAKAEDASIVAEKVASSLAKPFSLAGHDTCISASIGIAVAPDYGTDPDTLLGNADIAMYKAKELGRSMFKFFNPGMHADQNKRLSIENDLRGALQRQEFLLYYQPRANVATGEICGFEALLRWNRRDWGMVLPDTFIPVLEETGLIVAVGEWVIQEVCEQLLRWRHSGVRLCPVAINLSAQQFANHELHTVAERILTATGIEPQLLDFELTESMLMTDSAGAIKVLKSIRAMGIRLAVDDFGTGYSSLAYLKRFPLDTLKIDRVFVRDVCDDESGASIVSAIIGLAHSLNLNVVAEGVETREQFDFLKAQQCDEIQGYYLACPLPPADCTQMLQAEVRLRDSVE